MISTHTFRRFVQGPQPPLASADVARCDLICWFPQPHAVLLDSISVALPKRHACHTPHTHMLCVHGHQSWGIRESTSQGIEVRGLKGEWKSLF